MRIDPCEKRFKDQNKGYVCVECGHRFVSKDLFFLMFKHIAIKLCYPCTFKLGLELNDKFELQSLLDGTDDSVTSTLYAHHGISKNVYNAIMEGKKIQAIKNYRDDQGTYVDYDGRTYNNCGLKEAKEKVEYYQHILNSDPNRERRV